MPKKWLEYALHSRVLLSKCPTGTFGSTPPICGKGNNAQLRSVPTSRPPVRSPDLDCSLTICSLDVKIIARGDRQSAARRAPGEFDDRECPSRGLAFSLQLAVQKASFRALALSVSDQQHRDSDLKDEEHLIDESLRGDSQAFGELVCRYQDRLYNAVVHIVRCRAEAEDVVQEAFVQAYVKLQTFKHNSRFYTWLYRIAVNVSISHRRRRKIEVSVEQNREATGDEPLDAFTSPSEPLEQAERKQKLEHALTLLTEEHRSIIVLRHMEEFSYEEIADILDISVGTVRSRLHRARAQLLVHLKKVMPDEAAEFED